MGGSKSLRHTFVDAVFLGAVAVIGFTFYAARDSSPPVMRFDRVVLLEETSETSANVSFGDLNGDGHVDAMLAKGRHWPLVDQVLLNDGKGTFRSHPLSGMSDRSYSGLLVDLDGDGDLDVVISNDAPDPKRVYLNEGHGSFTAGSTFGRPEWETRNAAVADLNGDGRPDIVVANRSGDKNGPNYICLNRGGGKFDGDCIAFSHASTTTITPADFDRDGHVDLIVPHRDEGQSYIYLNEGKASFPRRIAFGPADAAIRVSAAADFNGDGRIDLAVVDEETGPAIYLQQTNGTVGARVPLGDGKLRPYALAVADVNRDGRPDIIVGNVESPSLVFFNTGNAHFESIQFGDSKGTAYGIDVADVNEDGIMDIAVARSDAPNVLYLGSR
jgi:hypothetical protein